MSLNEKRREEENRRKSRSQKGDEGDRAREKEDTKRIRIAFLIV